LIGATFVLSSFSSTSLEDVAAAAKAPLWFQLYARTDKGFTRELVERAQSSGYSAICLTVDTPIPGTRTRERRARGELPELPNLRGLNPKGGLYGGIQNVYSAILDPSFTWKDLEWLLSTAKVPVIAKGVLNPEDAERAVNAGVAGIIVS